MQHEGGCHVDPIAGPASDSERAGAQRQYLSLAGLGCPNCAARVRNALLRTSGVVDAEVSLRAGLATVWYDPDHTCVHDLVHAVTGAGRGTRHQYLAVPVRSWS